MGHLQGGKHTRGGGAMGSLFYNLFLASVDLGFLLPSLAAATQAMLRNTVLQLVRLVDNFVSAGAAPAVSHPVVVMRTTTEGALLRAATLFRADRLHLCKFVVAEDDHTFLQVAMMHVMGCYVVRQPSNETTRIDHTRAVLAARRHQQSGGVLVFPHEPGALGLLPMFAREGERVQVVTETTTGLQSEVQELDAIFYSDRHAWTGLLRLSRALRMVRTDAPAMEDSVHRLATDVAFSQHHEAPVADGGPGNDDIAFESAEEEDDEDSY